MKYESKSIKDYISQLPEEWQIVIEKIRKVIQNNIPDGFEETLSYNMIGYVVPHSIYPKGYHVNPKLPLPFINLASQKNFIALYHMGVYSKPEIMDWFVSEYPKYCKRKLDMGKSCIRFKKMEEIPYQLIGELVRKISVEDWIDIYGNVISK